MITASNTGIAGLSWWHIIRLGLIQTSLGGIVVLTTSTLNRIMVVELALAATIPGFLVTIHHVVQLARPRIGYGSDVGGRRTPWIIGGMFILGLGGVLAALGTTLIPSQYWLGMSVSALGFFAIGVGTGATGTSLLALLAKHVAPERKPAAAALVWFMMIIGFAVTAGVAGHFLDPYSPERLMTVTSTVSIIAIMVTLVVIRGIEPRAHPDAAAVSDETPPEKGAFSAALAEVWQDPQARVFTIFVFVSMLAYSAQDLILEPFAGLVFGRTPGESTQLAGVQHGGVLLGMAAMAISTLLFKSRGAVLLRFWIRGGCLLSAVALFPTVLGRTDEPDLVIGGQCLPAGHRQRWVRRGGNWRHDGVGQRRTTKTGRHPHGLVGCGAGHRFRPRRFSRHGGSRCHPLLAQ